MTLHLNLARYESPTGTMMIVTDDQGMLRVLEWTSHEGRMISLLARQNRGVVINWQEGPAPGDILQALELYHQGELSALDTIPTATGGTPFQREVWAALRKIPAGQTLSYQGLAERIGRPKAMRAVGLANGANPIAIVVPCHRVIGANGSLTGYGGGLERKHWLLRHEGVLAKSLI